MVIDSEAKVNNLKFIFLKPNITRNETSLTNVSKFKCYVAPVSTTLVNK